MRSLRMIAALTTCVVGMGVAVAGPLPAPPAVAAALVEAGKPQPQDRERVVRGRPVTAGRLGKPRRENVRAVLPALTWPAAGVAEVTLSDPAARLSQAGSPVVRLQLVGAVAAPATSQRLRVETHQRAVSVRAGVAGPVFSIGALPGTTAVNAVTAVTAVVDYAGFAEAFGGAFGSRLRLAQLPPCALTTPLRSGCTTLTPLRTVNNTETKTVSAVLDLGSVTAGEPVVFAAVATVSGDKGDFGATPLAASATWQVNTQSGDFGWSYGMRVPPVPGELMPVLALNYSSGSIDGRTASTNNQGSWVGDGFELSPGHIERKYKPCKDDGVPKDPTYQVAPVDQCWAYDNATLTLGGLGGELIATGSDTWKLAKDDGTRIERIVGSETDTNNGDNNNEYWRVTTPDGTRYLFGKNRLPNWVSGDPETHSTWTAPVFGDDDNEPCHAAEFSQSWCQQAWRWNLDYIEDVHGNAVVLRYQKEKNHYARNLRAADDTEYVRGGYLTAIDYGLRRNELFPARAPARVEFTNVERCIRAAASECAVSNIDNHPEFWPDVPFDLNCEADTECKDGKGTATPSFWTRKRLTKITTKISTGTGYRDVDSWSFTHDWGIADIDRQLLLTDIVHTGHAADEALTMPPVKFVYANGMHNRVDKLGDDVGPLIKQRVASVYNETGGELTINYTATDCSPADVPVPQSNHRRCFPVFWVNANGGADPSLDWFHKYAVAEMIQTDLVGGSPDVITRYDYTIGRPSWRYTDDDGLTPEKFKTWSQWRGYDKVRVISGATSAHPSQADHWFFQGMHGDRLNADGGTKTVRVSDGENATYDDHESLQGMPLRTVVYDRAGGTPVSKSVMAPWHHQTASRTRPWGTMTANLTGTQATRSMRLVGSAWWETLSSVLEFDQTTGAPMVEQSLGDVAVTGDEQCTRATKTAAGDRVLALIAHVRAVARSCGQTPDLSRDLISDVRNYYDGGTLGAAPTKGDVTTVEEAKSATATAVAYQTTARSTYDSYGRTADVTDVAGRTSSTVYTEANGLTVKVDVFSVPRVNGDLASRLKVTREIDPAWGRPTKETDPGDKTTKASLDALGRTSKVWSHGRHDNPLPDNEFRYHTPGNAINAIQTRAIGQDGGPESSFVLLDGWLRPRQAQGPGLSGTTKGRIVSDTFYNEAGQVDHSFEPYYADGLPQPVLFGVIAIGDVEAQHWYSYDGQGRTTVDRLLAGNSDNPANEKWRTTFSYGGNWTRIVPPAGGTPRSTFTDIHGRTTEVREERGGAPVVTRYTYDHRGQRKTVTGPGNQVWSYEYDLKGRVVQSVDPDRGTELVQYNDLDQPTLTTDARGRKVRLEYDALDRKVAHYDATSSPETKLVEWVYDTVRKGQLTSASRIVNGNRYTSEIQLYDDLNRPRRTRVMLPASEGALAPISGYIYDTLYNPDGTVASTSYPAAGELPAENMTFTYDALSRLKSYQSLQSTYLTGTDYSKTGKVIGQRMQSGATGKQVDQTFLYEFGTGRLEKATTSHFGMPGTDRSAEYKYHDAGNVKQIIDTSRDGVDNQCFLYDGLSRLTEAWSQGAAGACATSGAAATVGGPAPYRAAYTYDDTGNRLTEAVYGAGAAGGAALGSRSYAYAGMSNVDPAFKGHQLASVAGTIPGAGAETRRYDPSGNTVARVTPASNQTLEWDAEGNLAKVVDSVRGETSFLYAADGSRLIRRDPEGTTLYLPGTEVRVAKGTPTVAKATRFYPGAMRTAAGVTILVGDHHGTSELAINAATGALSQRRHTPFGQIRSSQNAWPAGNEKGFVGGTVDAATGLTQLGARSYDPNSGRFISVDPLIDMGDSQQMNGYNYSANNPVTWSDPDGLMHPAGQAGGSCCTGSGCFKSLSPPCGKGGPAPGQGCEGPCDGRDNTANPRDIINHLERERQDYLRHARQNAILQALKQAGLSFIMDFLMINDLKGCFGSGNAGSCFSLFLNALGGAGFKALKTGRQVFKRFTQAIKIFKKIQGEISTARKAIAKLDNQIQALKAKLDDLARTSKRPDGPDGASCNTNSFLPHTRVLMANGAPSRIDHIKPGDKVIATDPETGQTEAKSVSHAITGEGGKNLVTVTIATAAGAQDIVATDKHPFWVADTNAWLDAKDLRPGHLLRTSAGTYVQVAAVKHWTAQARVHNLTVDDIHTFYVLAGDQPVLVHNCWGGGIWHKEHKLGMASGWASSRTKAFVHRITGTQPRANATVRDLIDLNPGNRQFPDKASDAAGRDADEMLESVFRPKSLMYMTVNPHKRSVLFEGNHRRVALMRLADDPNSGITWDTEIYIHRFKGG